MYTIPGTIPCYVIRGRVRGFLYRGSGPRRSPRLPVYQVFFLVEKSKKISNIPCFFARSPEAPTTVMLTLDSFSLISKPAASLSSSEEVTGASSCFNLFIGVSFLTGFILVLQVNYQNTSAKATNEYFYWVSNKKGLFEAQIE